MSENAQGSGKARRMRELEKQQQAALKEDATPATPPQDDSPAQPAPKAEPEQDTPPAETEKPKDESKPALKTDEVDYREPYRKTQRELAEERQKRKSLEGRIEAQTKELRELKRKLEHGEGTPDIVAQVKETEHYKKLVEDFGQETADQFMGIAQHFADMARPQQPEPGSDPEPTPEPFGISSYDEFVVALDGQVEGWDLKYNNNPAFIEWAQSTVEPLSGETYLDLLNRAANETFDLNTAKRIFSAFDRQVSKTPSTPRPDDYVEPTPSGGDGQAQPEAPTYKESDLKAMETKFRQRKISLKEFEDFNAAFSKAHNEGRVLIGQ